MGFFNNKGSISVADKAKLDSLSTPIKNNLIATEHPTATNDSGSGYSAGSTWIYGGITYTCTDATVGNATWASSADIFYFDSWSTLIASISVVGSTYTNKYAVVSNANGGNNSGTTYSASSGAAVNPIVDGNSATYKINTQGTNYSVTCQVRTVTNPVVTSVMLTATTKPVTGGYYIFSVVPTNGLPSGIGLNDIAYFDGTNWSLYQKYSSAIAVLVAGTTTNTQVTWRKFNGTWMSTADEYVPDGNEYQTGKLWSGKPVYRKCKSGTMTGTSGTNTNAGFSVPVTGKIISIAGVCNRTDNATITITGNGEAQILVGLSGTVVTWTSSVLYLSRPFTAWVEYTKS